MRASFVVVALALSLVAGEPNHCCFEHEWQDGHCTSYNLTWADEMCTNGFFNLTAEEFVLDSDDLVMVENAYTLPPSRYCLTQFPNDNDTIALACYSDAATTSIISSIILLIFVLVSLVCLILTITVYVVLPYLRDVLGICILITVCMVTTHSVLQFLDSEFIYNGCFLATILHISSASEFFWMLVLSIHLYLLIKNIRIFERKRFIFFIYVPIGWGLPALLIGLTHVVHHIPGNHTKPFYGDTCWYYDYKSYFYYYFLPVSCCTLVTVAIYCVNAWSLWRKASHCIDHKWKSQKYKCILCFSILVIILCNYAVPIIFEMVLDVVAIFWTVSHVMDTLQGICLYLLLIIFRKRVRRDLAKKRVCCICIPKKWGEVREDECVELDEETEDLIAQDVCSYNSHSVNLDSAEGAGR